MGREDEKRQRFGRNARLRTGSDFRRVRQQGSRLSRECLIANWLRLPEGRRPRLGVVTGAKIGGALERNRTRRLLRECFRLHQHEFEGAVDLVLVARRSLAAMSFAAVEKEFLTTVRKARLLK